MIPIQQVVSPVDNVTCKTNKSSSIINPLSSMREYYADSEAQTRVPVHDGCGGCQHSGKNCQEVHFESDLPIHHALQNADSGDHFSRNEDLASYFDSLFMATFQPSLDLHQDQEIKIQLASIFGHTHQKQNNSENPVRKFTNGVPTQSVDPTNLPPPNRLMRARSRATV
jgi:hypothetical protein